MPTISLPFLLGLVFFGSAHLTTQAQAVGTPTGKCVWMQSTSSFMLETNTSEDEVAALGIFDFDQKTYSAISAQVDRVNNTVSRRVDKDRPFYVHNDEISGVYKMTFNPDPTSSDHLILVPSNASNTIFIMDPTLGAVGVCQKL